MKNKNQLHCCEGGASIFINKQGTKAVYSCGGCNYTFEIKLDKKKRGAR